MNNSILQVSNTPTLPFLRYIVTQVERMNPERYKEYIQHLKAAYEAKLANSGIKP